MARTASAPSPTGDLSASDVLGRVTLVTGKEEFLGERTVAAAKAAVKAYDAEAEVSEATAAELTLATLGELSAPSLFSSIRCVVVRNLENLPDESVESLVAYAGMPAEEVALVLVHGGGQKGSGTLAKLRKLPKVTEHKSVELKAREFGSFVKAEVRRHGGSIDEEGADFLIQAVGQDLRALSAAASQLASDNEAKRLGLDHVKQYFGGRAEVKNYVIADAIISGDRVKALEEIRWALDTGSSPVYVLSAVAGQLRTVANHVAGIRDSGTPPWKQKSVAGLARGWTREGIGEALRSVARADADLKGAASDPAYTLERLVLTIAALRQR
ncbi:DNA polymerase III subunit delta [Nocardioides sp. NPDC058538]|uniref:DNA polymerase III subunit delta n=1 Tax=Nocardioides sp. NPDC058538 TaxID=3346542 RepID=UPI003648A8FD